MMRWLIEQTNGCCRRLWRDESGVVLAITVVVFLTLFVMVCAVYAVGENIRQRIELQNAADAAAYSAAVIQADAISRIAAINKVMAWTYIDMVKREQDFIVDRWMDLTMQTWMQDQQLCRRWATTTPWCQPEDYWIGSASQTRHINAPESMWWQRNGGTIWWLYNEFFTKYVGNAEALRAQIAEDRDQIAAMNQAEAGIILKLEGRIRDAAQRILFANLSPDGRTYYKIFANSASECFEPLRSQDDESLFYEYVGLTDPVNYFGAGYDDWFVFQGAGDGLQRVYRDSLVASWNYSTWGHYVDKYGGCHRLYPALTTIYPREVRGSLTYEQPYYNTAVAKPQRLNKGYFGKSGALVVGVTRFHFNPFMFLIGDASTPGIYGAFDLGLNRRLSAVAASRAGYQDGPRGQGAYNPTIDCWDLRADDNYVVQYGIRNWINNKWSTDAWHSRVENLSLTDWDAVLLPLHRAWSERRAGWERRAAGAKYPDHVAGQWVSGLGATLLGAVDVEAGWQLLGGEPVAGNYSFNFGEPAPSGMNNVVLNMKDLSESLILH